MFSEELPRILQLDMLARIAAQIFLFSASAFFSGSETALFSLSRFDLQRLSRSRSSVANVLHGLLEQPRRLIVSILCGNELVNIAAAANMTAILVELLGVEAATWAAAFIMIPLILLFGEVTPKTIAVTNPVWTSTRIVARPVSIWVRAVAPLAFVVRAVADRITTLIVGPERTKENILHLEDLQTLVEEGIESGEMTATERSLIQSLISGGATEVREIMTPRSQVGFIDASLGNDEIRTAFLARKRTRVPVYRGNRDNVIGFLYVEDFLDLDERHDLIDTLHQPICVAPTKRVDEMLDFLDERKARAALVISEYGSVEGIITLSDVTNFLFSGVFEGAAGSDAGIVPVENGYEMEGGATISAIRKITGLALEDPLMSTIAGKALRQFGRVPEIGDEVEFEGLLLTVLGMEGFRISRLRLERVALEQSDD
jgi:CBS domain containing-hemolysin-like protein